MYVSYNLKHALIFGAAASKSTPKDGFSHGRSNDDLSSCPRQPPVAISYIDSRKKPTPSIHRATVWGGEAQYSFDAKQ